MVLTRKLPVGEEHLDAALVQAASQIQPEVALEGAPVAECDRRVAPMETDALDVEMVIDGPRDLAEQGGGLPLSLGHQDPLTELLEQAILPCHLSFLLWFALFSVLQREVASNKSVQSVR